MLYLFAGDDAKKKLASLDKFLASLKETEILTVSRNNFSEEEIQSLYSGSGLFAKKTAVIFESILDHAAAETFLLPRLEKLQESENIFIFSESKISKTTLDAFKKGRAELNIFELPAIKKEKYNNFILANDFGARDKLNLWIHFREAVDLGVGLEELIGVLFWKAKDLLLKENFSKFSAEELKDFSSQISYLLPQARREGLDAEAAFEEFILEAI